MMPPSLTFTENLDMVEIQIYNCPFSVRQDWSFRSHRCQQHTLLPHQNLKESRKHTPDRELLFHDDDDHAGQLHVDKGLPEETLVLLWTRILRTAARANFSI